MSCDSTFGVATGAVTIALGSDAVLGIGTTFTSSAPAGTVIRFTGSSQEYEVLSVTDDTHLTLNQPSVDASVVAVAWSIAGLNDNKPYPDVEFLDYDYFLSLFNRIYPQEYLSTLKSPGPGYELIQAFSQIGQRLSLATARMDGDAHILDATGGALATGSVLFTRPNDSASQLLYAGAPLTLQTGTITATVATPFIVGVGTSFTTAAPAGTIITWAGGFYKVAAVVDNTHLTLNSPVVPGDGAVGVAWSTTPSVTFLLKANTLLSTSIGDREYTLTADTPFDVGELVKAIGVVAVAESYQYNVTGAVLTKTGLILPGEVDSIVMLVENPPLSDTSFVVSQPNDICGGSPPTLDQLGADRGIPRKNGESDPAYRNRVRTLPDTVSPQAMVRAINSTFSPLGATATFVETFQIDYQTCWDAPSPNLGTPTYQVVAPTNLKFNSNLFVYDDPRPAYPPFANRWLDITDYRAAFIAVVPNLTSMMDVGMAYDDTAMNAQDLLTPIGQRAVGAYDVPTGTFAGELQGGYDGFDLKKQAVYKGLYEQLQQIKAGGVSAVLELQGQ